MPQIMHNILLGGTYVLNLMEDQLNEEGEDHKEDSKEEGRLDVRSNVRTAVVRSWNGTETVNLVSRHKMAS